MTLSFGTHAAQAAFAGSLIACLLVVLGTWWFGRRAVDYSHRRDTISELGAAGTRDAFKVAWLWFFPNSVAFAIGALGIGEGFADRADDAMRAAHVLAAVGIGWIGAALFPCDRGAPLMGTLRNHLHNFAGGAAYLAGAAGLIEMGTALAHSNPALSVAARIGGGFVLIGLLAISADELPVRGLIQRVMEVVLHGWLLLASLTLLLG